ncbi:HXXEE domain-containing protein [Streptomyces prunicolor]|uniref:HXXEE domain-containing protein n=1 Tax=Streptomyces prunicolor TaxID=67348 RepID=UPI00371564F6
MGGQEVGEGGRAVEVGVTFGLLAAWAVHDLEEVTTMPSWARGHVPGLRQRYPRVPEQVWRRLESIDGREFAAAVAVRGYTPGVVTSPLAVIPFTLWARGRLRRAGVLRPTRPRDVAEGLALAAVATVGTHAVARQLLRRGRTATANRT